MFPLENPDCQDTDARDTDARILMPGYWCQKNFQANTRLQLLCFRLRFLWRKPNWWWLRFKILNIERNQIKWRFLESLDCYQSDAWIKTKSLLIESFSTNRKCSMETLVGRIIPVVTEKYEFVCRNKTIKLNNSLSFWLSRFWWKHHKYWFFNQNILYRVQVSDWGLDETNQAYSCWEVSV